MIRPRGASRARVYVWRGQDWFVVGPATARSLTGPLPSGRNLRLRIYGAVTLSAGNLFLDEIWVADDAPLRLADRNHHADRGAQVGRDADRRA